MTRYRRPQEGADPRTRPSSTDRPSRSAVLGLAAILVVAAAVYTWSLGDTGLSPYYAAAARSMATAPRALAFGALDPAARVTLDKLSGFLLPQALAVAVLGFHPWVLDLPQVAEGLVTITAGFVIGHRWHGPPYGVWIAALLATTPILAAVSGRPTEDAMVTMCQVLAFAAAQRSLRTGRPRWLIVAGLWLAVGFQAKMMQSWLVLPAIVVVHVVGSRATPRARAVQAAAACVVCVLASIAWMSAIQAVPPSGRPFVDGTTDNDMFSMVFGYDGFDRVVRDLVPGAVQQLNAAGGASVAPHTRMGPASASVLKLVMPQATTQVGWLYPCALAGVAFCVVDAARRARAGSVLRGDRSADEARGRTATAAGLAVWLVVTAAVLSAGSVPHAAYFAAVALPIAAFAVHGAVRAVSAYRASRAWPILPLLVAVQSAWTASIIASSARQLHPLLVAVLVAGTASVAALLLARLRPARRLRTTGLALGLVGALAGPVVWTAFTIGYGGGGSASDAFAGPRIGSNGGVPLLVTGRRTGLIAIHRPFSGGAVPRLSARDQALLRFVDRRNRPGAIPFAGDTVALVVDVLTRTRADPLLIGGYSGEAPEPAAPPLQQLVRSGRLRFVLLQTVETRRPDPALQHERSWVRRRCRVVLTGRFRAGSEQIQDLYDCRAAPRARRPSAVEAAGSP